MFSQLMYCILFMPAFHVCWIGVMPCFFLCFSNLAQGRPSVSVMRIRKEGEKGKERRGEGRERECETVILAEG